MVILPPKVSTIFTNIATRFLNMAMPWRNKKITFYDKFILERCTKCYMIVTNNSIIISQGTDDGHKSTYSNPNSMFWKKSVMTWYKTLMDSSLSACHEVVAYHKHSYLIIQDLHFLQKISKMNICTYILHKRILYHP